MRPFRLAATAFACAAAALATVFMPSVSRPAAKPTVPALYTPTQAKAGAAAFAKSCASCHGVKLEGGVGPPLSGPNMATLGTKTNLKVGELFGYMTTNMPMNAPASLSHDKYVQILAFILEQNGYPSGPKPLTYAEAESLKVTMTSYK